MLGLIIVVVAALTIRRLWPTGVAFIFAYPLIAVPIQMQIATVNGAYYGDAVNWSARTLILNYFGGLLTTAVIFFATLGVRFLVRLWRNKRGATGPFRFPHHGD